MPDIKAADSNLSIAYRIEPGDGTRYVFIVMLMDVEMGRDIIRGANENYALVIPYEPRGYAYPFLRSSRQNPSYVADKTGLDAYTARVLAYLLPSLTNMIPPDDILDDAIIAVARARGEV